MNKLYTFAAIISVSFCLFSFSTNPPDGHTGAPGDMFCFQCHSDANPALNGTITLEGFPDVITPNETYSLKITNRVTEGVAVRGGFQMTILSPFNTRAGDFSNPDPNSAVSVSGGRQYWDHDPALQYPDSNQLVSWTVLWKAPEMPSGSLITWYAAGNIANGNFQNTGDRIVGANGSGTVIIAATGDASHVQPRIFPNPGSDILNVICIENEFCSGNISFYNLTGHFVGKAELDNGKVFVPSLIAGVYLLKISNGESQHVVRWTKL